METTQEATPKVVINFPETKAEAKPDVAEMEQGIGGFLDGFTRMEVMGLPVGKAAVGAVGGLLIDRLVGERLAQYGPLGNLAVAFAVKRFGSRFLGSQTADAIALVLTYEALVDTAESLVNRVLPGTASPRQTGGASMNQVLGSMSAYAGAI